MVSRTFHSRFTVLGLLSFVSSIWAQSECTADTFKGISLDGTAILSIKAQHYGNFSVAVPDGENHYAKNITGLDFCEVIVTYTHPGYNDTVNTYVWLPRSDKWNGRFLGVGGGGWTAGTNQSLPAWTDAGFAAVVTDGGHDMAISDNVQDWAFSSDGNIDWNIIQVFFSIALDDAATFGKAVTRTYYGKAHSYSYWSGCSQGGRQGHMMAQRYPEQYDGILAAAPAIYWSQLLSSMLWPQVIMNELGQYPSPCEHDAVVQALIKACDPQDGLEDGIVAFPDSCEFDYNAAVGQTHNCSLTGEPTIISEAAAKIVAETYTGPMVDGKFIWYGVSPGADVQYLTNTTCTDGKCLGNPVIFARNNFQLFLKEDPNYNLTAVNSTVFARLFRESVNRYTSIMGTSNTDLTDFRNAGGKLITWHGLADQLIPPHNSLHYFDEVLKRDPEAKDYARYFEAPGLGHCAGGPGWYPGNALQDLMKWVENGTAPETLEGKTVGAKEVRTANLCLWPKHLVYSGGDPKVPASYGCE